MPMVLRWPARQCVSRLAFVALTILAPACAGSTDSSQGRFEPIPATETTIRGVVGTILQQTLMVDGRCSTPHFINCPDGSLASPVAVDLVPASLSLTPLPGMPSGYTYVAEVEVAARREVQVRIGEASCLLSLGANPASPSRIVVAGNAVRMEPTDGRPYQWVDMTSEMMAGLELETLLITGGAGCDPAGFNPQSLSILIGELLPRKLEICKPEGAPYQLCAAAARGIRSTWSATPSADTPRYSGT